MLCSYACQDVDVHIAYELNDVTFVPLWQIFVYVVVNSTLEQPEVNKVFMWGLCDRYVWSWCCLLSFRLTEGAPEPR